ncbi:MAG: helix-turn-helix domain-containing protein [Bacteroides sp.]
MSDVIDSKHERIARFVKSLDRMIAGLEKLSQNRRIPLNGEIYLTDKEVSERLKVSRRTLQEWRNEGQIAYIQLDGKIIYPESALQSLLDQHHRKAWV